MVAPTPADVLAIERAYAEAASRSLADFEPGANASAEQLRHARACVGAVASHFLAVGTPRSFGVIGDASSIAEDATAALAAHRTWFAPRDLRIALAATEVSAKDAAAQDIAAANRTAANDIAAQLGARVVEIDEALACDIVCVHVPIALAANQVRRGTHVNAVAAMTIDDDLRNTAKLVDERTLALMVAGKLDGRELDEITIFLAGELGNALTCSPSPSRPSP